MTKAATLPVIDISAKGADQAQVAKELVDAAIDYGFVYIKSQDISAEQIDNAFNLVGSRYFGLNKSRNE